MGMYIECYLMERVSASWLVYTMVVSKVVRMDDQMVDGRVASLVLDWVDL